MKKAVIILSILAFVMNSCGGAGNKPENKNLSMDSVENEQLSIENSPFTWFFFVLLMGESVPLTGNRFH